MTYCNAFCAILTLLLLAGCTNYAPPNKTWNPPAQIDESAWRKWRYEENLKFDSRVGGSSDGTIVWRGITSDPVEKVVAFYEELSGIDGLSTASGVEMKGEATHADRPLLTFGAPVADGRMFGIRSGESYVTCLIERIDAGTQITAIYDQSIVMTLRLPPNH